MEALDYSKAFDKQISKDRFTKSMIIASLIIVICCVVIMVGFGTATIDISTIIKVVYGKMTLNQDVYNGVSEGIVAIIWEIRLPRILTGVFVGAGLAMSGTVFQALLMNPLADPYTIGISTGAALGATIAIYLSSILGILYVAILPSAFAGALIALFIVISIAGKSQWFSASSLIIAGIIVSSIGSAAISLIKSLSGDEVSIIVFWLMGSLAARTWNHVLILIPVIIGSGIVCYKYGSELNLISLGEINAKTLGVEVKKVRLILLITASLLTATCVSVSGIIGFVGLIIPHILRQFVTTNHKYLIPLSGIVGALLLMLADNITRSFLSVEIPVGVLTTLIGGPFFIYLFTSQRKLKGEL